MSLVAIHQPNFFPWLGYFDKIARADVFVFLDHVQYPKKGGVWTNRVKLLIGGAPNWFTATINRQYHGTRCINEMSFLQGSVWREKLIRTLEQEYKKHPFYSEVIERVGPLLMNPENSIAEYNIKAVMELASAFGLTPTKFKRSSDLQCEGTSNELLCAITRSVGGDTYLCGGGAEGYQKDEVFAASGIKLRHQNFQHPIYPQKSHTEFVPGLSIIDALMNQGFETVRSWLRKTSCYQKSKS